MRPLFKGHRPEVWRYVIIKAMKTVLPFAAAVLALFRTGVGDIIAIVLLVLTIPASVAVDLSFAAFMEEEVNVIKENGQ